MEVLQLMWVVVMVLVGSTLGLLLALNYKFDKLKKAVDELKRFEK